MRDSTTETLGRATSTGHLAAFAACVADDLMLLALLHDRELDHGTLVALKDDCLAELVGLPLTSEAAGLALEYLRLGLSDIPEDPDKDTLDTLAAEYADIYLNHSFNASPCESVWTDDDGLARQRAMFETRDCYARHGLAVRDWRIRSDDHLVPQLQFVIHLLEQPSDRALLGEIADFLDEHLLRWIDAFALRVSSRCRTRFYAGLALLTAAYLDTVREHLARLLDQSRPSAEAIERRIQARTQQAPVAVAPPTPPGLGVPPGW
jgi:TorA maturation chaperone TorD